MSREISRSQPVASAASSRCEPRPFPRRFQFCCGLGERQVRGFAVLVDLLEAAVCGGAFRQRELFVVGFQIRFGVRIVVGVHHGYRLRGRRARRQAVGGVQILRSQAKCPGARRRRGQWRAAREPERVLASASRSGSRHELQRQAPAAPTSGRRAHRTDGVVRTRQRRDAGRGHGREAEQSKHCAAITAERMLTTAVRAVIRSSVCSNPCRRLHGTRLPD